MFLAITRKKDADENFITEVSKAFIETNAGNVVQNLEKGAEVEYYIISLTAQNANLKKCSIKSGVRTAAPGREIVEVEADGNVVGSAEIET